MGNSFDYSALAKEVANCGFGVQNHSGYFAVNEQEVDGVRVQTVFTVHKGYYRP